MSILDEISEDWQVHGLPPTWGKLHKAQTEYDELRARVVALEADAARYRWLRETRFIWGDFRYISGVNPTVVGLEFEWFPTAAAKPTREDLDAAIDAALEKKYESA